MVLRLLHSGLVDFTMLLLNRSDIVCFRAIELDGSQSYRHTFSLPAWPHLKARWWSSAVVDAVREHLIPNALNRHLLSSLTPLRPNPDNSLTLLYAPVCAADVSPNNWLPVRPGQRFNLTYRFYMPTQDLLFEDCFPPLEVVGAEVQRPG